jgi:SSS family solute:Na+ symporter
VVLLLVAAVAHANFVAAKLKRSVADFLAANRMAGQYLLAVGEGTAGLGAVTVVAYLEQVYSAGFVPTYWMLVLSPISMVIAVTGFVRYRFR